MQQIRLDNKYADIIFEDRVNRKIIVGVKRGILTRDTAGQVMKYYGWQTMKSEMKYIGL